MKLVGAQASLTGRPYFSLPRAMLFMRKPILRARVRMVCMPSLSRALSPSSLPKTTFQYWEPMMTLLSISKGMFMH